MFKKGWLPDLAFRRSACRKPVCGREKAFRPVCGRKSAIFHQNMRVDLEPLFFVQMDCGVAVDHFNRNAVNAAVFKGLHGPVHQLPAIAFSTRLRQDHQIIQLAVRAAQIDLAEAGDAVFRLNGGNARGLPAQCLRKTPSCFFNWTAGIVALKMRRNRVVMRGKRLQTRRQFLYVGRCDFPHDAPPHFSVYRCVKPPEPGRLRRFGLYLFCAPVRRPAR